MTGPEILAAVTAERARQSRLWDRDHDHGHGDCSSPDVPGSVKVAVLTEEVGEVARAFLDGDAPGLRRELTEVVSVGWAWLEGL
jgi:hypothetical protein